MAYDAVILGYVEDALAECFNYHQSLDSFVIRSGVPSDYLAAARGKAEQRARARAAGQTLRAPKRFVAQQLIADLTQRGEEGDRLISNLITAFVRGTFREASPAGLDATSHLKAQIESDHKLKKEQEAQRREEARERAANEESQREAKRETADKKRRDIRQAFVDLSILTDLQARGYNFEKFLTNLFEFEGLQPRGSFRMEGEQIDGSFIWRGRTFLTEAKWTLDRVAGAEFGAFSFKLEGKTADTRGLFIAVNGYTEPAIRALNGKGSLRFVCLDGAHLMRAFEPGWSLTKVLEIVWRHADESGEAYLPVIRFPL